MTKMMKWKREDGRRGREGRRERRKEGRKKGCPLSETTCVWLFVQLLCVPLSNLWF